MSNVDNFKSFVKKNPNLVTFVRTNEMTWQKFYELYDLYGENNDIWNKYLKKETEDREERSVSTSKTNGVNFSNIIDMAKNIDTDKLQDGISSVQKAISLFGDMIAGDKSNTDTSTYTPRPIYRKFDD